MAFPRRCKTCEVRDKFWCPIKKKEVSPQHEEKNCKYWRGKKQRRAPPDAKRGHLGGG